MQRYNFFLTIKNFRCKDTTLFQVLIYVQWGFSYHLSYHLSYYLCFFNNYFLLFFRLLYCCFMNAFIPPIILPFIPPLLAETASKLPLSCPLTDTPTDAKPLVVCRFLRILFAWFIYSLIFLLHLYNFVWLLF